MYNPKDENVDLERDYLPSLHSKRFQQHEEPDQALLEHFDKLIRQQTSELTSKHGIKVESNLRYGGEDDRQLVDIYYNDSTAPAAPLFVFIHGGYWQILDKESSGSMVAPLVRRGYRVAIMDYNLCPQVTLEQLCEQFTGFLNWIFEYAEQRHSSSINFAGHSAGAHLLAQLLHEPVVVTPDRRNLVCAVFLISGVYDLRELWPLQSVNPDDILSLDAQGAAKLSPMLWQFEEPASWPTTLLHVLVAANDSVTFIEQSRAFSQVLQCAGFAVNFKIFDNYDHFDIIEETAIEGTPITEYLQQALL